MRYRYYIMFITLLSFMTACKEESDSQLITSVTQLTFPPNGGSQTIRIESNTDWVITSDASWLSVYPSTGNMGQNVTVTVATQDNKLAQETRIVVATKDGRKVVNISARVEGSDVKMGQHLEISSVNSTFGGKAGSVDSIRVVSNINWEVLGSEWLEGWDGERWRPLSPTRGVIKGSGTCSIPLRTVVDNKEEEDRKGVITVREQLTGEFTQTVNVSQVGRLEVQSSLVCMIEDAFAFSWICGCDVENIYFKVVDATNERTYSIEEIRSTFEKTDENYINSVDHLTAGKKYIMITAGEDSQGNMPLFYSKLVTMNEERAASVKITTAVYAGDGQWNFSVAFNNEVADYDFYATDSPNSAFQYSNPILWHLLILKNNRKGFWNFQTNGRWVEWHGLSGKTDEIHAMAEAWDYNGKGRQKMFRYDAYYDPDGKRLPAKPLLYRIRKDEVDNPNLLP